MPVTGMEALADEPKATMTDRITNGVRRAAHVSHQVRLMKSIARDAGEEGVHAAKRVAKRLRRGVDDFRDESAYRVKREPFKAVGAAAVAGLLVGVVVGWVVRRRTPHAAPFR